MKKNKILCTFVFTCLTLFYSCKENPQTKSDDNSGSVIQDTTKNNTDTIGTSDIDSIRAIGSNKYAAAIAEDTTPDQDTNYKKGVVCKPCDIEFLVYLNDKSDYNMQDIKTLLCLDNNNQCEDNAEFSQFYNEMIFKVFQRERKDLTDAELNVLLKDMELVEELSQPINDKYSTSLLKELKEDAENPND